MSLYDTILYLCSKNGITKTQLERDCGFSQNSINKWATKSPSSEKLSKVADYFDVSVDYLLGKNPKNIYPVDKIAIFEELGTIRAGFDGSIDECPTGRKVEMPISLLHGRPQTDYFTLRIKGDSMYPIFVEGDTILCLRTDSVDSGEYAVILYDGDEATVKKVNYIQGEDWLELIPINPMYKAMRIEGTDLQQCRVIGKVTSSIRQF